MPAKKITKPDATTAKKALTKRQSSANQSPALRPTMLLVLGMHRSGTSVTTRLLDCLDAVNSNSLMPEHPDNPKGFFEDHDIYQFNENTLLPELGIQWQSIGFVDWTALPSKKRSKLALEALEILRKNYPLSNPLSVLKEPRIGILLPFWLSAIKHAGFNVKVVCAVRDPVSVARSLGKRDGMSISHGGALYLTYWISILSHIQDLPVAFVQFDEIFKNPSKCLGKIARKLALPLPEDYQERLHTFSSSFIEDSLRHNEIECKDLFLESDLPPLTIELYQSLLVATKAQNIKRTSKFITKANKIVHPLQPVLDSFDEVYAKSIRAKQLEAEVARLTQVDAATQSTSKKLESALDRESLLRGQIAEKITRLEEGKERHKTALAEAQDQIEQLQQQLDDRNTQLQRAEQDKEALAAQVETLRADMTKNLAEVKTLADSESQELESALERESLLRRQLAEKVTHFEKDKQLTETTLAESKSHAEQLQQQLDDSNARLQASDKDKEALISQVESLQTNAEQLQLQIDESKTHLQASDKDKQALAAQVASLQANVDDRFEELAKLSQLLTEIEDSRLTSKLRSAGKLLRPRKS